MPFSIRDIFTGGNSNASQSTQQQPVTEQKPAEQQGVQQQPAGENKTVQQQESQDVSPLDSFKDLWQPNKTEEETNSDLSTDDQLQVTPELLQKSLENVNFSAALDEDTLTAISEGGENATKAFAKAMTGVAKQTMMQSILIANKITEQRIEKAKEEYAKNLPKDIRSQTTAFNTAQQHPIFKDPALQPVVEATQSQLLQKYPHATPAEITEMTVNYFTSMGKLFNKDNSDSSAKPPTQEDWSKFLEL